MRQTRMPAKRVGQRVEPKAQQHPGEDQEQGGREVPGEREQHGEQHHADAADRNAPSQIKTGRGSFIRECDHAMSFRWTGGSLSTNTLLIKTASTRWFDAAV